MQQGFTLVEMLVVMAIMGILLAAAIPAGSYWINNAKISNVQGSLIHAVGLAKSTAIRNQRVAVGQEPVVAICISDQSALSVLQGTEAVAPNCLSSTGTKLWGAKLDTRVSVTNDAEIVNCMCFNNLGMLTSDSCTGCLTESVLYLAINDLDETLYIY